MNEIIEFLKFVIPPVVVFLTAYFMIRNYLQTDARNRDAVLASESKKKLIEVKIKNQELITPIRLQAYERVVLLLERISPGSLVMRVNQPGVKVKEIQKQLIASVREEFEHNLSQQVYISSEAWELCKEAREQTIRLINESAAGLDENAPGAELSKKIFENVALRGKLPVALAIDYVKEEIYSRF